MRKRLFCCLLSVIMLAVCILPSQAYTLNQDKYYLGDVNQDGVVTAVDARWILQMASGIRETDKLLLSIADMTRDAQVTAVDARWALQTASGLRELMIDDNYYEHYPVSTKGMICPLQYPNVVISAGWYGYPGHKGIDFATSGPTGSAYGKEIRAAADGVVYSSEYHYSWGNNVYINHGNGVYTRYAHCSKLLVGKGQTVKQGQVIAYVGNTGNVSPRPSAENPHAGAHLHFEVWVNGERVNPAPWLP